MVKEGIVTPPKVQAPTVICVAGKVLPDTVQLVPPPGIVNTEGLAVAGGLPCTNVGACATIEAAKIKIDAARLTVTSKILLI